MTVELTAPPIIGKFDQEDKNGDVQDKGAAVFLSLQTACCVQVDLDS